MKLLLREVFLDLDESESVLPQKVADHLGLSATDINDLIIIRKGIDARKKKRIRRVYSLVFSVAGPDNPEQLVGKVPRLETYQPVAIPPLDPVRVQKRVLVVGMGPAGLFAALRLACQGVDVVLVEQGEPVEERIRKVRDFWTDGALDPRSNVQFGEGGAGTFSDGKLTTRVKSPWNRYVLETLVACGASDDILLMAKPHLGTDVLRRILISFRGRLQAEGVEIRFGTALTGLETVNGRVRAGIVNDRDIVEVDAVVLAPGHSARETYSMLAEAGVQLEQKPFAVGFRVEHPAELINCIQYGLPGHPNLTAADYALSYNDPETKRGVYSFCMCPGGEVITASSEVGGMVVNGMSASQRDKPWSNSALVAAVGPDDFDGTDPLAGVRFQRHWEEAAFRAGGGGYFAPAQNLLAFLGCGHGDVRSSCRPGVTEADLNRLLPGDVVGALKRGISQFDRRMKGFVTGEAVLVGV